MAHSLAKLRKKFNLNTGSAHNNMAPTPGAYTRRNSTGGDHGGHAAVAETREYDLNHPEDLDYEPVLDMHTMNKGVYPLAMNDKFDVTDAIDSMMAAAVAPPQVQLHPCCNCQQHRKAKCAQDYAVA